jgi:hypothetical protein
MEVMPSRPVTLVIVAFWLFTAGWFVVRDIGPFGRTGDPPPYTIELSDEAMRTIVPDRWTCTLNGRKIGTVRTVLAYEPRDDTFEFRAKCPEIVFLEADLPLAGHVRVLVKDYDDRVRVTREGELRAMETSATLTVEGIGPLLAAKVELAAEVRRGRLERRALLEARGIGRYAPTLKSTDPPRGTVLNPMHPVPKITGLRPGQTWRQPLTDPRTDILRAALAQLPVKVPLLPEAPAALTALVLPEPRTLDWNGSQLCFVIEYRGDEDYVARTWVRISDSAVLRQEAGAHGETVVLQRE